jgi:O-antigen/teichoic acid export membrane protein
MTVTAYRQSALAGMLASTAVGVWQIVAAATTALAALPLHLIHLALYGGLHVGIAALAYVGYRGARWSHQEARRRELPRSHRKTLSSR